MDDPLPAKAVALFLVDAIDELARCKDQLASSEETRAEFARLEVLGPARRPDGTVETTVELVCKIAAVMLLRMREQVELASEGSSVNPDSAVLSTLDALRSEFVSRND